MVEHGTENAGVDSSSLSLGTINNLGTGLQTGAKKERKWLSGRAPPCQGGGREFKSRLPLQLLRLIIPFPHVYGMKSDRRSTRQLPSRPQV